jgi:hypothetical protein
MPGFTPRQSSHAIRLVLVGAFLLALIGQAPGADPARAAAPEAGGLRVDGPRLLDASGKPVRLLGVNRSGTEYACAQGWGIFDGPHDAASVVAMRTWEINTVRVPLNEQCWLGLPGVPPQFSGATYRAAIAAWVATLRAAGLYVILDLHLSAPSGAKADRQQPMPDRDNAPEFWRQVATAYGNDGSVLFDLFNEPFPDLNGDSDEAWRCWRDGGACSGIGFPVAGMQELVDVVRGTGATNVILLAGVQYGNSFSRFRAYAPRDPVGNLAASFHAYNFMLSADEAKWDAKVGIPTAGVPLVATEVGQDDCETNFIYRALTWLDARGASYIGWAWNTWSRCDGSVLIKDYDGTPSVTGQFLRDHLASLGPAPLAPLPGAGGKAGAVAADPAQEPTQAVVPPGALVLYDDVVRPPFQDGPFGVNGRDPCDRRARVSGYCSYALVFSSWGGLGIGQPSGFATTGYDRLVWDFNANGQDVADFSVALTALDDGRALHAVPLDEAEVQADLGGGWLRLVVPVSALNPDDVPVREVVFRNVSGRVMGVA